MKILYLFIASFIPVAKFLLITAVGVFLALDRINLLGLEARYHLNKLTFYVFNSTLVASTLANSITIKSVLAMWFMPVNLLITTVIGSFLGWLLVKIVKPPRHSWGLIIACSSAGNTGPLLLIMIPAICKQRGTPFGDANTCYKEGMTYSSLSLAVGVIYLWSYVFNLVRIFAAKSPEITVQPEPEPEPESQISSTTPIQTQSQSCVERLKHFAKKMELKKLLAPSTIGAIVGFFVGTVPPIRHLLVGNNAPLSVVQDTTTLIGKAAIPTVGLIVGANLLQGLRGSGIKWPVLAGIALIRYAALPVIGVGLMKAATHLGIVKTASPLYQFVLLLQFALPPAVNIGTMTQLFGAG